MPIPNALLGLVEQITTPDTPLGPLEVDSQIPESVRPRLTRVRLATGGPRQMAYLDRADKRFRIWQPMLETLQESGTPAFVRVAPDTGLVTEARIPVVGRVLGVERNRQGTFDVRLDTSPARETVSDETEEGRSILEVLRKFEGGPEDVIVTANHDEHRIIDVSPPTPGVRAPRGAPVVVPDVRLLPPLSAIDRNDLDDFYAELRGSRCRLPAASGDCLPVLWGDDLCYVMADHMCNLLARAPRRLRTAKVWLHGSLQMKTRNHPQCEYRWSYHVAALLRERGTDTLLVIDPVASLDGPLTLAEWRDLISGNEETPLFTPRKVFNSSGPENFIEAITPESTRNGLKSMRDQLRQRANNRTSPPPFGHCPLVP